MEQPARLTSDLLARKGGAQPIAGNGVLAASRPDDTGPGSRRRALLGAGPGEPRRTEGGISRIGAGIGAAAPPPLDERTEPDHGRRERARRVALTLRLDPGRHTRLRILAARREQTSQELMVEALDALLEAAAGECACLRERLRNAG